MKKKFLAAAMVAAALSVGAVAVPIAAHATLGLCATGKACGFQNINFDALITSTTATTASQVNQLPDNDQISSIANKGTKDVGWYTDANIQGRRYCETANDSNANVGTAGWNDQFSSLIVYSTASVC